MTGEPAVMYILVVAYLAAVAAVCAVLYGGAVAARWAACYGPIVVRHLVATTHAERVAAVHARYGPPRRHGRRPTPGARYLEDDGTGR